MTYTKKTIDDPAALLGKKNPNNHISEDAEAFFHMLDAALDIGVSILDENLDYQYLSQSVYDQLNLTDADLKPGDPLSHCHDLMVKQGLFDETTVQNKKFSAEQQKLRASEGQDLAQLVQFGNGKTMRFVRKTLPNGYTVSMSDDVSELVEKDHLFEQALALGNAGYWRYDFATKTYALSQSLETYFGAEIMTKIHKHGIISCVHPEDREMFRQALKKVSATRGRFDVTCRSKTRNGRERWSRTTGQLIKDKDGNYTKIRAFVKDVTRERSQALELERAKDEAIAASRAKSEFLANMSHEIRTPMNGVLGMAELLANTDITDRQREFVKVINQSSTALLSIINDILDFSKIEAGAMELDPMPFNLRDVVNDVASLLSTQAQEKGLELVIDYPGHLDHGFIADGGRMRQVLMNLVGNAIKFTEEGYVFIDVNMQSTRNGHSIVTINVTDTGIGIETAKQRDVFKKFTQGDGSTTRVYGGTGLGLSITKHLVELMGGRISVRSVFGKGSTFSVSVPMEKDPDAKRDVFNTTSLKGRQVLIVDDIAVNRQILTERLKDWGMIPSTAIDGVKALEKIKAAHTDNTPYDLIIVDYLMPGMNGQELASFIKSNDNLDNIPCIMLSSVDQIDSTTAMKDMGIDIFLTKPAREKRLHSALMEIFGETNPLAAPVETVSVDESSADSALVSEAPEPAPAPKKAKIELLVAEDFILNQDVIRLMLADTDYLPNFVMNGQEALEAFKAEPHRYATIIMDVSMPVMDGYDSTRAIRQHIVENHLPQLPIIALTGHALTNDRELCIDSGMDDYLTKPVKQITLLEKLDFYTQIGLQDQLRVAQ